MKTGSAILLGGILTLALACQKDKEPAEFSTINVELKDAPAAYDAVNVEVVGVDIHSDADGWIHLPVTDSIYDLLLLQDSSNAVLGTTTLTSSTISQIRLILGDSNTVVVSGTAFPLSLSSQDETGLKLNVHQLLAPNVVYKLVIDFDAAVSVIDQGGGSYRLKPVLTAEFTQQ